MMFLNFAFSMATLAAGIPPELRAATRSCTSSQFFRKGDDEPTLLITRLQIKANELYVLYFMAGAPFTPPYGSVFEKSFGGGIYEQLDDQVPTIVQAASYPAAVSQRGFFQAFRFEGIRKGKHRVSIGIVSHDGEFLAYDQRCFVVSSPARQEFPVPRLMPTW